MSPVVPNETRRAFAAPNLAARTIPELDSAFKNVRGWQMGYKQVIRRLFEDITGTRLYQTLPRGVDLINDIRNSLPNFEASTVFDVGANIGQSARDFSRHFPKSQIYCFEPIDITYNLLRQELRDRVNIRTFKLALGAKEGPRKMVVKGHSEMFHLQPLGEEAAVQEDMRLEQVAVQTLDGFCQSQGITHIDFLKIDAEGHDLEILRGAEHLLNGHQIDVIQVEAGMNGQNRRHVAFDAFMNFLEPKGYSLFGIYEQMNEWLTGSPNLRRTNPVFLSKPVIKLNTPSTTKTP